MVDDSRLFSFLGEEISGDDVTRMNHIVPCFGLSISRQPPLLYIEVKIVRQNQRNRYENRKKLC